MQNAGWRSGAGIETQLYNKVVIYPDKKEVPGARTALKWAVAGLFCFGFVLGCVAIAKAGRAMDLTTMNPGRYLGEGKALAAMALGAVDIVVWTIAAVGVVIL